MPHLVVLHQIKQSDVWKGTFQDKERMDQIMKTTSESKFIGQSGYSLDVPDKQFCLWNVADLETAKEFPDFFHKVWNPQTVADSTKYYVVADHCVGAPTPPGTQYEQKGKGTFAFVHHKIKDNEKMKVQLQDWLSKGQEAQEKSNLDAGFWNHQFFPTTGETEKTDIFCVWELKEGKTKADLKTYLDTYLLKADSADNVVYICDETSGANMNLPTSKFAN